MPLKLYQRGKVWHYRGTVAGRRLRGSCKTADKAIAQRQIAEIETRQWKCNFDGPQAVLTFSQAAMMYRAAGKPTRFLARIEDYWKDTLVKDIPAGAIRKMAIDLYPGATMATRNRQAIVPCQAIINLAADSELCPYIKVKRYKTEKKVKEPFTLEWVQQFRAHASPQLGALALFMFVTGARVSEALRIRWDDVELKAKTAIIRKTKISEGRVVNLPNALVAAMANIPKIQGRPVFLYRHRNCCYRVWDTAVKRAGIKRLTFHSGRHGFATTALRSGIDPKTGAWLGGWKSIKHFMETYAHAIEDITLNERILDTPVTQKEKPIRKVPAKRA
jgi:integrase